jgi:hypothetical protein
MSSRDDAMVVSDIIMLDQRVNPVEPDDRMRCDGGDCAIAIRDRINPIGIWEVRLLEIL